MIALIVVLLILWAVLSVLGFVLKGLFWLVVLGIILLVATGVFAWIRRGSVDR